MIQNALRSLPRVDELLACEAVVAAAAGAPRSVVLEAVRRRLDAERARIKAGERPRSRRELEEAAALGVSEAVLPHLHCVVNATGVVVHTNLGRAPLSSEVAAHVADVASHYSTLEFDLAAGARGSRHDHVRDLLCTLTGAEDAAVVNNGAAAVMLVLSEFARGREAVVSRGELVEIGGSFRIPDVMELSGARMVEVGTTNKTHLCDFERAITEQTAMLLKVHPSNYRVVGFHEEVDVRELAALAHARGVMVYEDQGSGTLVDLQAVGLGSGEHTPAWSLAQGVDVVTCSGDKLLGASQAGIVLGASEFVGRLRKNPLMRALRPDKMTLAALEATLRCYLDEGAAWGRVPVLRMLGCPASELLERARRLFEDVCGLAQARGLEVRPAEGEHDLPCARIGHACLWVAPVESTVGGGALPTSVLPGFGLRLCVDDVAEDALRSRLLACRPRPVAARVGEGSLVCDVRTLLDERDENDLVEALVKVMA